ncbi:MAG TPA: hypothetical protein VFJ04_01260 [Rhodanobacteraceae bacterium]|nr:hypothetical protein [Rhodanobacteraceae bacterium]
MSPQSTIRSCLLALALLLGACSSAPRKDTASHADPLAAARKALATATPCCNHFSDFDFAQTLPSRPKRFTVGPGLPMADFNGSRSWFLAFRLPDDAKLPYQVLLKSVLTGRWLHTSYLYAPTVVLLDAGFRPLHTEDVQLCEYIGWTQATSGAFGHFGIDDPAARYLVVYSSGSQLAGSTYWEQSPAAFSAEAPVKMASTGSFQIPHGPDGTLFVGMLTPHFQKVIDGAICGKPKEHATGVLSTLRSVILPARREGS